MSGNRIIKTIISFILCVAVSAGLIGMIVPDSSERTVKAANGFEEQYQDILDEYTIPEWFRDAKFGIFIHYGVYAVPAYGDEWYPKLMYLKGRKTNISQVDVFAYNEKTYGSVSLGEGYGYKQFIPAFSEGVKKFSENNMAEEWADLFEDAGAKYVMPVGIHHDGYALYDSDVQVTYNTVNNAGVDYAAELQKAVKAKGMHYGISNHFAENDGYYDEDNAPAGADIKMTDTVPDELYGDGKSNSDWHIRKWFNISMEIINKYKPDMIYYDYGINYSPYNRLEDANRYKMLAEFYEQAKETNPDGVVCNYKEGGFKPSQAVFDKERSSLAKINPIAFQTDTSIGTRSWGYTTDERFRSAADCIKALIDVVSKNGNLLLNVGPMPDGTIPDQAKNTLLTMGDWLSKYGDAIYATRPWITFGEGPTGTSYDSYNFKEQDIRFTRSKDYKKLYAIVMAKPTKDKVNITTLNAKDFDQEIGSVSLINGSDREELDFEKTDSGLEIYLPDDYNSRFDGPFAMEITAADGGNISTTALSVSEEIQACNMSDCDGVAVKACPNDGTDMIVSESSKEGFATYHIDATTNAPGSFSGVFSGDSNGVIEFHLGGKDGRKIGEMQVTPSDDGKYHTLKSGLQTRAALNSNVDITIVLKGDISLSSFRLVSRNPGEVIEAENYDDMHGSFMTEATKDSAGGTENIGGVTAGEWAKYSDVNFAYGVKSITVRHASQAASRMEVRLDSVDGPLIVSMDESATGSWNDYTTATVNVNTVDGKKVTGLHDIYVIFRSIMNLNWFKFTACDPVDPTDMKLVKDAETIEEGQTCWIDAEFEPYDASERVLEYSSDDENVAVVSEFGEVTGKAPGKTTIQVTSKAVPSLKAVFTVTVTKKPEPVQENKPETTPGTTVNTDVTGKTVTDTVQAAKLDTKVKGYLGRKITLKKGKKLSISATLSPEGSGKVLYSSSNSKVATVSDTGVVKAKKTGTVKITVQNESGSVKTVYTVKVVSKEKVNKKLKLKKNVLAMKLGDTGQIAYKKITGDTTSRFSFKSSKKNVASVDAYGVIRANAKGNAVIKVKCGKKTAKIKVKVS